MEGSKKSENHNNGTEQPLIISKYHTTVNTEFILLRAPNVLDMTCFIVPTELSLSNIHIIYLCMHIYIYIQSVSVRRTWGNLHATLREALNT